MKPGAPDCPVVRLAESSALEGSAQDAPCPLLTPRRAAARVRGPRHLSRRLAAARDLGGRADAGRRARADRPRWQRRGMALSRRRRSCPKRASPRLRFSLMVAAVDGNHRRRHGLAGGGVRFSACGASSPGRWCCRSPCRPISRPMPSPSSSSTPARCRAWSGPSSASRASATTGSRISARPAARPSSWRRCSTPMSTSPRASSS